jgi:hypothetical protein
VVFPVDYPYSSGHSKALHANFEDLAEQAAKFSGPMDLVVDIGANDGTLLSKFPMHVRTLGVEPTDQADSIDGYAMKAFFGEDVARTIKELHGPAKVITACNVLAHVENIDDVMAGIKHLLADDGVLIAENHDLASVVDGQWDTIYHEHLRFFSPHSFAWLLRQHELSVRHVQAIPTHGGSFRTVASKGAWGTGFAPPRAEYDFARLDWNARSQREMIRSHCEAGTYGIGATARATTLINYCGLDVEDLACVCEVSGSDKIGRLIPGTRIPVVDEVRLWEEQPPRAMLLSWHMADVIVPKLREKGYEGEIIVPLPSLEYA